MLLRRKARWDRVRGLWLRFSKSPCARNTWEISHTAQGGAVAGV
jgi:hypothetical protein